MSDHRGGPVRSEAARLAILGATSKLFASRGFDHLTMEGIAAEAGVSKQTIYRWWPTKGALVAECLVEGQIFPRDIVPPDTGDLRRDLATWLSGVFNLIEQPQGEVLVRSLLAAAAASVDVGLQLDEMLGATSAVSARLRSGIAAYQLRADAPVDEISQALLGTVILRALGRKTTDAETVERLVDAVVGSTAAGADRAKGAISAGTH